MFGELLPLCLFIGSLGGVVAYGWRRIRFFSDLSPSLSLLDIVHADQKLYLVFEFLDVDLKRYIETGNQNGKPITALIVKVSYYSSFLSCPSSNRNSKYCTT